MTPYEIAHRIVKEKAGIDLDRASGFFHCPVGAIREIAEAVWEAGRKDGASYEAEQWEIAALVNRHR